MEASSSGTAFDALFMTRRELFMIMKNSGHTKLQDQIDSLQKEIVKRTGCVGDFRTPISQTINRFKSDYKSRWEAAHRMESRFCDKTNTWLDSSLAFRTRKIKRSIPGRPAILFEESTERMKRQRTQDLRKSMPLPELVYATQMKLKASGQGAASKIIKDILCDPLKPTEYSKAYQQSLETVTMVSGEDAVALLVEAKLSRHQYNILRSKSPKIYPSYKIVQAAKKQCYPEPNQIIVSETSVHVDLQIMLDLTTKRLALVQREVLHTLNSEELENMCLFSKWGFDGSSGHSSYKQAFYGSEASDAAVFITCYVPLRLTSGSKVIWQNPRPSSTRYCIPLKIEFVKESAAVSVEEKKRIDDQIRNLEPSIVQLAEHNMKVNHTLIFAMIDGKVCNAVTNTTSTQKCYICGATTKDFNDIAKVLSRPIKTEHLEFGISVLHGWIRFFECLLHLPYRLPIKKKQARKNKKNVAGVSDKEKVEETKRKIQTQFKERLGLIVDKPKPGFGNSNDGNTARRFFKNAAVSAEITNLDLQLIQKMHNILIAMSSGYETDVEKFRTYATDTAKYFVQKYPWFDMPPTFHKFFIHGPEIIKNALLPIGQLTEEAQEARNKDFKKFREHHSRKCSREKSNADIFNLLLLSSDPVITSKRKLPKKKLTSLPQEVLNLLIPPSIQPSEESTDDDTQINSEYDEDTDCSDESD